MLKKWLLYPAGFVVILPVFTVSSWLVTEKMLHETSGEAFCGGCHSMQPFTVAYRQDLHGGNSSHGIQAACTECHLPHDNLLNYLITKARFGIHDVWAELTYDLESIDWEGKRKHRETYVFDSGCRQCHSDLQRGSMANAKAFVAHKPYFLGATEKACVSCHQSVGHDDLSSFIKK